jgi:hypothetical protein
MEMEEDGKRMSLDLEKPEIDIEIDEKPEIDIEEEAEVARRTEARCALSPGHPFSYPPLMLRYLYARSSRGALRALAEAVESARRRRRSG